MLVSRRHSVLHMKVAMLARRTNRGSDVSRTPVFVSLRTAMRARPWLSAFNRTPVLCRCGLGWESEWWPYTSSKVFYRGGRYACAGTRTSEACRSKNRPSCKCPGRRTARAGRRPNRDVGGAQVPGVGTHTSVPCQGFLQGCQVRVRWHTHLDGLSEDFLQGCRVRAWQHAHLEGRQGILCRGVSCERDGTRTSGACSGISAGAPGASVLAIVPRSPVGRRLLLVD